MLRKLYLALLGIAVLASSGTIALRAFRFHEVAWDSDPFGYLEEARIFRRFYRGQGRIEFTVPSRRIALAAQALIRDGVPIESWRWWLGPRATHYFPDTGRQGIQYPPGTGFVLSFFPEGRAVAWVDALTAALLCGGALGGCVILARRGRWAPAGPLCLCALLGLDMLRRVGDTSFSVQVSLPLVLGLAWLGRDRGGAGWPRRFAWGALGGVLLLTRLANVFLIPGLFLGVFSTPGRMREGLFRPFLAALAGVALFGALPLLLFQKSLTGHYLGTTYADDDRRWASFHGIVSHLDYYLGAGGGAVYNWALLCCLLGAAVITGWRNRALLSAVLVWAVPAAFFVFHQVAVHYYLLIPLFASALQLSLNAADSEEPRRLGGGAVALALVPGLVTLGWAGSTWGLTRKSFQYQAGIFPAVSGGLQARPSFPAELLKPRAWDYAYLLTGSFWYYERKGALEIMDLTPTARLSIFRLAYDRGEPQYFVDDWEDSFLTALSGEVQGLGGRLVRAGEVEGHGYYRLEWLRRPGG